MLETSDKFFQEYKKPDPRGDQHVLNAIKVMMQPEGTSSIDGARKIYKSWPDYCKTHKFMSSSANNALPDIIMSEDLLIDPKMKITDQITDLTRGQ